jgi:peptidoglycan/LPS O-acetylase OafA/YrhL
MDRTLSATRIPELDGLRGAAIGMVLFWHYFAAHTIVQRGAPLFYALAALKLTWTGVDLFFVLSGFLIGGILLDVRESANYFKVFYIRRLFRIVPIYFIVMLVLPYLTLLGDFSHHGNFDWFYVASSAPWYSYWTFTQNFWMAHAGDLGGFGLWATWSLAVEEQFYLTLPVLLRALPPRRFLTYVVAGICAAPVLRICLHFFWAANKTCAFVLMPCRADALLLGVLAAILIRDPRWRERLHASKRPLPALLAVFLAGIVFLNLKAPHFDSSLMMTVGYTWLACFYALVLLFALTRPSSLVSRALRAKWLGSLGVIAYGIYLIHQPIQWLFFAYFWSSGPRLFNGQTLITTLAALATSLLLAGLSWRFIERPLVHIGRRSHYQFTESAHQSLSTSALQQLVNPGKL